MPGHRHTRPRGRRDLEQAYRQVQREVTSLSASVRLDSYEINRLLDVITGLRAEVQRLSAELAGVRAEIAAIRATGRTDPLVQILAEQASELREQLTASRLAVATMTSVPLPSDSLPAGPLPAPVATAAPVAKAAPAASNGVSRTPASPPVTSLRPVAPVPTTLPATAAAGAPSPVSASPEFDQLRQERPSLSELIGVAAPNSGYAAQRRMTEGRSAERNSAEAAPDDDLFDESPDHLVDLTAETIRLIRTSLDS